MHDSPKGGLEVPSHLLFHREEADITDIRNLIDLPNTAQLIEEIKIVDEYAGKKIAEIMEDVINENVTVVFKCRKRPVWQLSSR